MSIVSPSFTDQAPPCNTSSYEVANGTITPQPGDAVTCLKYPQSASGVTVGIAAAAGAVSTTRNITLPPCPPGSSQTLTLAASQTSISSATGGFSNITATLLNPSGQPVGGATIFFTKNTVNGTIIPTSGTTDTNGQIQVTLFIDPGTPPGGVIVTGTASGGASGTVTVTVSP